MIAPRLDVTRHLALYTAFHRAPGNKLLHGLLVPVILFSMMCLQAYVRVPADGPADAFFHLATVLSLALVATLATVDLAGAVALAALLAPGCALAGLIVEAAPWWLVVPSASLAHLAAWWGTVKVGHERVELAVECADGPEDSNVYFRRGYYLARGLGCATGRADALVQFCVAPLSVVQDGLVLLGLRRGLEHDVAAERARVLLRMAVGAPPLDGAAGAPRAPSASVGSLPIGGTP